MKKLRGVSLIFLTIGGLFSALFFGLLIIFITKINPNHLFFKAGQMLLEDIARVVLQFSDQATYHNVLAKSELVGGILTGISSFFVLMYLIPNYLTKNGGYKGFGAIFALIFGFITCFFLTLAVVFATQTPDGKVGLSVFKLGMKINSGFVLLFIGPVFTFLGGILATVYYRKIRQTKPLTKDQQNRLSAINLTTGKIGAKGLTPQKEMVRQAELPPREDPTSNLDNKPPGATDLKSKMALLKAKMARNAMLNEQGEAHLAEPTAEYDNSRWKDNKAPEPKPTIRVGKEGQYLRTIKEGVGVVDESPTGVMIEKEGNFVKKGDIIKHHDYSAPVFNEEASASHHKGTGPGSIIIPKSKQHMPLDTRELEERIGSVPKISGKQRVNPNARVDNSYDGKVFLGDIDKIWTASKKYREAITKQSEKSKSHVNPTDNFDDYVNNNNDNTDEHEDHH
ncbi:MFS transporter [Spiroplasma sp. SV19]|uniref:MFS transporter n=1 Tax=Spiroplasma sp. SV19 TaxID=2570468 RepID=UPI0024B7BE83|nr:MFS transporter [Spiroplasma sp. SV19]WHQ36343.1 MFS transporter [Spiroplasma sp. SV19]